MSLEWGLKSGRSSDSPLPIAQAVYHQRAIGHMKRNNRDEWNLKLDEDPKRNHGQCGEKEVG